jgi:hypothetical protein
MKGDGATVRGTNNRWRDAANRDTRFDPISSLRKMAEKGKFDAKKYPRTSRPSPQRRLPDHQSGDRSPVPFGKLEQTSYRNRNDRDDCRRADQNWSSTTLLAQRVKAGHVSDGATDSPQAKRSVFGFDPISRRTEHTSSKSPEE